MNTDIPIELAYEVILPWLKWGEVKPSIFYGKTANKAKYQAALTWDYSESDWFKIKARRAPEYDLFKPILDECLTDLPKELRQIISHANGNETMSVGFKNYYCTDMDNQALLKLVSVGLMRSPVYRKGTLQKGMAYFFLTEKGRAAAFSMLPRKRGNKQKTYGDQKNANHLRSESKRRSR